MRPRVAESNLADLLDMLSGFDTTRKVPRERLWRSRHPAGRLRHASHEGPETVSSGLVLRACEGDLADKRDNDGNTTGQVEGRSGGTGQLTIASISSSVGVADSSLAIQSMHVLELHQPF